MNIVYLVGNGFDLNLGMNTRYEHFYTYLSALKNIEPHIAKMLKDIENKPENWSDLEFELGNYLRKIDEAEAVALHGDLVKHLSDYIASEEDRCNIEARKDVLCDYLISPHNHLTTTEKGVIFNSVMNGAQHKHIRIISFNYSKSIEKLSDNINNGTKIGGSGYYFYLTEIEHIHGSVGDRMMLGVNDTSQINNDELRNNVRVVNRYVKSSGNDICGHGHDKKCNEWITNSQLICVFGMSFGATDKKWWETIAWSISNRGAKLIIFECNKKRFNNNQVADEWDAKDAVKERFLSQTSLKGELRKSAKQNIFVAYNKDMFKFNLTDRFDSLK